MTIKEMDPHVREMIVRESHYRDALTTCSFCRYSVYSDISHPYCRRYEALGRFEISDSGTCDGFDPENLDG